MFKELSDLHKKCFPESPWSDKDFAELKQSGCEIIMSQNAFIVWRVTLDEAEIITIGVAPEQRRTGIATAMLRIIEKTLKEQQVKKLFLEVSSQNIAGINMYKKQGFNQVGIRPKYYVGTDALIMEKDL